MSDQPEFDPEESLEAPPGASPVIHRLAKRAGGPVNDFLHLEAAGGIVLLLAATVALIWANSAIAHTYHDLWHTPVAFGVGSWQASVSLHFIINDGLMTIFFLVVGMEIKREIVEGELSDLRRASLPIAAAVGGMLLPALVYFSLNPSGPASAGWGVPMATDIAFAVGILSLLGKRVPAAMRILLLALAIIDDLGAILVIAIFYTADFQVSGIGIAIGGFALLFAFQRIGIRSVPMYGVPLIIIWAGLLTAGVHPTLAGVIAGLATPVRPWLNTRRFIHTAKLSVDDFESAAAERDDNRAMESIARLNFAAHEALSPVNRVISQLHVWVAFGIMPLFALANAGVTIGGVDLQMDGALELVLGISVGLALGKPFGVMLISWLLVKSKAASLPKGISWAHVLIVGLTAGIGFTMAIFIAELAFRGQPQLLGLAKLAILIGTAGAAIVGLVLGRILLKPVSPEIAALSPADVERSTAY